MISYTNEREKGTGVEEVSPAAGWTDHCMLVIDP
jgi:hypothetical protein